MKKIVQLVASIMNISNKKVKQREILHPNGESFTALDELKQLRDQKDK